MKVNIIRNGSLPQWIISSPKAAYHPNSKTIWISVSECSGWWDFIKTFLHEFTHYLIHTLGLTEKLHKILDESN